MTSELSPREISDRLQISDLLDVYASGVDRRDWDAVRSVFTDDAVLDYSSMGAPTGGVDEVMKWLANALTGIAVSQHLIVNRQITVNGDEATVRAALFNPMGVAGRDSEMKIFFVGGYYDDKLRRTEDGWRITQRVAELAWSRGLKIPER